MAQQTKTIRYLPSRLLVGVAYGGMILTWLIVLGGLVGTVVILSRLGPLAVIPFVVMCGGAAPALSVTRGVLQLHRVRTKVPARLLRQRRHGDLTAATDDQNRPLRPVGWSVVDVVTRTDALLGPLTTLPGVQIFEGVRLPGAARLAASHAVSAGRLVVLIESVAWPPGRYRIDATGRIRCDGQYIGQTVRSLSAAVRAYRGLLPRSHQVRALVAVYRFTDDEYILPSGTPEVHWVLADHLYRDLKELLAPHLSTMSRHTIAALTTGCQA